MNNQQHKQYANILGYNAIHPCAFALNKNELSF